MFSSIHIGGPGLCETTTARLAGGFERNVPLAASLRTSNQPMTAQEFRATMTSVAFSAMNPSGLQHYPNIPLTPVSAHAGVAIPSSLIQYPAALCPNVSVSHANDMKQLALAQYSQVHHPAFPGDVNKIKSPFINRNYLELAMLVCNTFRGKLFPCSHCRYVTDRRNNLKRHISTMHQACDKLLECCGVKFSTKASLREHIMIFHHNGYSCPYCGRRFCRKALLKRHLSVHSGQKDYQCPHCDYATSHKSNLERHKRIHDRLKFGEDGTRCLSDLESSDRDQLPDTTDISCLTSDDETDITVTGSDDPELEVDDTGDQGYKQTNIDFIKPFQHDIHHS